jgi:PAS domain S-box-containing protein
MCGHHSVHAFMESKDQVTPIRWGSLSLRLSAAFVAVLVTAAFAVAYLFERTRAEAGEQRKREDLRFEAERGADAVAHLLEQLRGDVLFLADMPPIKGMRRVMEGGRTDAVGGSNPGQWSERVQEMFLAFGEARPGYFQLRLLGAADDGRELVRVDRTERGLAVTAPDALQRKGDRYYFREASRLPSGSVYLSHIDLNQEFGRISVPHTPTLRAATPVYDSAGNLIAVVVINMDVRWAFEQADWFRHGRATMYVADERGDVLHHPEPGRAFAFEFGKPFRLADAFPDRADLIASTLSGGSGFLHLHGPQSGLVAYLTTRAWDPTDPSRRLVFVVTQPMGEALPPGGFLSRDSLLSVGGLLALAVVLIVAMVRRLTRSLTALAIASRAITAGNYRIVLPAGEGAEVRSLVVAFRRMVGEVERREEALAALTQELEQRVEERTAELEREHALQHLILDNIADGVVVADRDGQFIHWNRKAEQIVGSPADEVAPERWSSHFGIYSDEGKSRVPGGELPLARAIRGESSDNVDLYIRNPKSEQGRWVQVTARPLLDAGGEIAGGVAVLVDVTDQKRLRQRTESHRADLAKVGTLALRAEIASSAAHQLSQPIAAMSNYAGAAVRLHQQGRLGGGELLDLLARIESLATQAGEILNKLRSRIRGRNLPAIPVDVNQVADSCLDFLTERILRQGVRVERRYGRELPQPIGDAMELELVLIHLVSNALEEMEDIARTEHRLSIATCYDSIKNLIVIEIVDTGRGLSPDLAERLLEPWQTHKPDALGMGLAVAQTLVETSKGRIRLENGKAGGALVRVELPVGREERV